MSCRKSLATLSLRVLSSFVNSNHSQITHIQRVEDVGLQPLGSCVNQAEGSITFTICFNS